MNDTLVLLAAALLRVPGRRLRALALGDAGALRDWLANESATRLAEARRDARLAYARLEALGARLVSLRDPEYPAGLRDLRDPPPFLTVQGTLPARSRRREGTAIVGTRTPDEAALAAAHALGASAAPPIVSGLALGVDAAAHAGALAAGARTCAYVATGPGSTYPPQHAELQARIVAHGGAVLSELLPDEPVSRWSLVRRDRLQAAHAAALVLVQSEAGGGAMHAVRAAAMLGRPRFALEPRAGGYEGNVAALRDGAVALGWDVPRARAALDALREPG